MKLTYGQLLQRFSTFVVLSAAAALILFVMSIPFTVSTNLISDSNARNILIGILIYGTIGAFAGIPRLPPPKLSPPKK